MRIQTYSLNAQTISSIGYDPSGDTDAVDETDFVLDEFEPEPYSEGAVGDEL